MGGTTGRKPDDESVDRFNAAADLPGLTKAEKRTINQHSRPNAALVHETIRADGQNELERTWQALLFSSVAAGLSIAFSIIVEGCLQARLPEAPWRELIVGLGYTVGFVIVVLGRQQLFTENTVAPILELLFCRDRRTLTAVARLWGLILVGNLVGAFAVSGLLAHAPGLDPDIRAAMGELSEKVFAHPLLATFVGGVFAGWILALMVWLLPASGDAAPFVIILLTYVIAIGGFQHSIAGSVEGLLLVHEGKHSIGDFLLTFFLPTVLGNVVGGVSLVAVLNYGQVASDIKKG